MVHARKYVLCVSHSRAGDMAHTESSRCRAAHISPTNSTCGYVSCSSVEEIWEIRTAFRFTEK